MKLQPERATQILQAASGLVQQFVRDTSSGRPRYFRDVENVPYVSEDPFDSVPAHEMDRIRLRLAADTARRQDAAIQRVRADAKLRRIARIAGASA